MSDENQEQDERPQPEEPRVPAGLIEKVARFYQKAMPSAQKARSWLQRHRLDDPELIAHFQLGCANGRLITTLPKEGEELKDALRSIGLMTVVGQEYFLHHITVPMTDGDGGLVGLAGISLGTTEDLLAPLSPTALWNARVARLYPELLLTLKLADGLSLHRVGFPHACAVIGNHLKPLDLNYLHDCGVRRISLFGNPSAARLVMEQLAGFSVRFHPLAPNDFLAQKGPAELVAEIKRLTTSVKTGEGRPESNDQGFVVSLGRRRYEVLGIDKNGRKLKMTIKTERFGKLHVDTLDLYSAKSRKTLVQDLCCFFEESPDIIDGDLVKLIKLCEDYSPLERTSNAPPLIAMTDEEQQEATALGTAEDICAVILQDFDACGLVGEESNKLLCYLAAISRKTDEPISVLILSSSGAGKSTLQDATLLMCPPEDVVKLTSLTGKALFYKGTNSLKHKILALEEEAGVSQASYAIRNLISAGELVIETTVKDLGSGRLTTMQNRVEGPTSVFITTTNPDVDPETRSRFFVTGVDESREQTRAILESQRKRRTWEGRGSGSEREAAIRKHRNYQRLLKPLAVMNPFAEQLAYTDDRLQSRRDQPKYLNLINAVAFLRQMRKPVRSRNGRDYVEVDEDDLRIATNLADEILGKSLDDLNRVSRDLLAQIESLVNERVAKETDPETGRGPHREDILFTRREIREFTGWPHMRIKRYIVQLVDMEFLAMESRRIGSSYHYRVCFGDLGGGYPPVLCKNGINAGSGITKDYQGLPGVVSGGEHHLTD